MPQHDPSVDLAERDFTAQWSQASRANDEPPCILNYLPDEDDASFFIALKTLLSVDICFRRRSEGHETPTEDFYLGKLSTIDSNAVKKALQSATDEIRRLDEVDRRSQEVAVPVLTCPICPRLKKSPARDRHTAKFR